MANFTCRSCHGVASGEQAQDSGLRFIKETLAKIAYNQQHWIREGGNARLERRGRLRFCMSVEALPNLLRSVTGRAGSGRRLAFSWFASARTMWRDFLPSTVVLACGIAIAIGGFFAARNHLLSLERRGFEVEAASYAGSLRDGVRQYVEAVNSIAAFVSASRGVDRWEFLRFAERTLPRYPGFAALEWVPRVQAQNRVKYERRAQVDGLYGLRIREFGPGSALVPAGDRPEYYPVYYIEPFAGHEKLLGFDLAADPAAGA